jgi:hypothetical protein
VAVMRLQGLVAANPARSSWRENEFTLPFLISFGKGGSPEAFSNPPTPLLC